MFSPCPSVAQARAAEAANPRPNYARVRGTHTRTQPSLRSVRPGFSVPVSTGAAHLKAGPVHFLFFKLIFKMPRACAPRGPSLTLRGQSWPGCSHGVSSRPQGAHAVGHLMSMETRLALCRFSCNGLRVWGVLFGLVFLDLRCFPSLRLTCICDSLRFSFARERGVPALPLHCARRGAAAGLRAAVSPVGTANALSDQLLPPLRAALLGCAQRSLILSTEAS